MSNLIGFFLSTGGFVTVVFGIALWFWLRSPSAAGRRLFITMAFAYAAASTYAVPAAVARILVSGLHQFSTADLSSASPVVVVLGGSATTVRGWGQERLSLPTPTEA